MLLAFLFAGLAIGVPAPAPHHSTPAIGVPAHTPDVPAHAPDVPTHVPDVVTQAPGHPTHAPGVPAHALGKALVNIQLFHGETCSQLDPNMLSLTNTECWFLPGQGLKVVGHDVEMKYNGLHVFQTKNCTGGWTLQPLDDACSDVSSFHSIRAVLHS